MLASEKINKWFVINSKKPWFWDWFWDQTKLIDGYIGSSECSYQAFNYGFELAEKAKGESIHVYAHTGLDPFWCYFIGTESQILDRLNYAIRVEKKKIIPHRMIKN